MDTKICSDEGNTHLSVLIIVSALLAAIITSQLTITTNYPNLPAQVLGDESTGSGKNFASDINVEAEDKAPINPFVASHESTSESKKGSSKVEFKAVDKSGKTALEAKDENKNSLNENEKNEVETELEKDDIHIATSEGQLIIRKNGVRAITQFTITVDQATNTLTITTASGIKTVAILPDQAVTTLLSTKALDHILSDTISKEASDSATPKQILLIEKDNQLVYQIKGTKNHKLLGLIPISTNITAFVSAESGNLIAKEQSLLSRIIELLSF
jgi:hypothetical protein